jgi:hypothetical protein
MVISCLYCSFNSFAHLRILALAESLGLDTMEVICIVPNRKRRHASTNLYAFAVAAPGRLAGAANTHSK